ncbi:DUF2232 domain-containing protein [Fodinicurvata sp. EGI_FJ10296]|uniref:DUF2232 domain-containing protein n=1 Tax=Fodinicurvata sp. EGI_FJ10296 TaxID=3231908 RepID=UPI003452B651
MITGKTPQAVAGGVASALCILAAVVGGPVALFLSWVAAVPLYMVGLSSGPAFALRGAAVGAVTVGILWLPVLPMFLLTVAIPVVVLSWAALTPLQPAGDGSFRRLSSGQLLTLMVGYAVTIITIAGFAFAGYDGGLTGLMLATMREPLQGVMLAMDLGMSQDEIEMIAQSMAVSLPAALGIYWVLWSIVNIGIANGMLRRFGQTLRPDFGAMTVAPPAWVSGAFVVLVAVAFASGSLIEGSVTALVSRNAVVLLVLVFFLVGVSVVHVVTIGKPARVLILTLFYVLVLMSGWLALVVAGLGIIEQWARMRERSMRSRPDEED